MSVSQGQSEAVDVSVIIPVLNEAEVIAHCLSQFDGIENLQILVVDGGSDDSTADVVKRAGMGEWTVAHRPGRSHQMNAGAALATGPTLLFLHADCRLPSTWPSDVASALKSPEVVGGRFRLGISEDTLSFRLIAFFSTLRSRFLGITYGDQAIFVRRSVFDAVGGFPHRMIFEDSEFCDAVARQGRFALMDSSVVSSSRRWRASGVWRTVLRMWILRLLYTLSVSDERLSGMYRNVR